MRTLATALLAGATAVGAPAFAAPPSSDARNVTTPDTDTVFSLAEPASRAAWEARARELRQQVLGASGLLPLPERTPLRPEVFGRLEREGYTVEKVLLQTFPGFYLGGNLYRPLTPGRHPAVLKAHGHWSYGRLEHQPLAQQQTLCANLARRGYVVFNYDMVGYDDTVQVPHAFGGPREQLWSFGPLGLQLWNSIRAVDFVEGLADVDPARIGMTGASGGATQTFLLYAVDDRIRCAAPVNMISGRMQGGDACENAPGLRVGTHNIELGATLAPRPLLMVSASGDWTSHTPQEEFPAVERVYRLFGRPEAVENAHFDAPHNFHQGSREAVYRFFARHLLGQPSPEPAVETPVSPELLQDVMVLHGRTLPAGAVSFDGLFAAWREASERQAAAEGNLPALRERLGRTIGVEWPERVEAVRTGSRDGGEVLVLGRPGRGDRVAASLHRGKGRPVLILHPEGRASALRSDLARRALGEKRTVLTLDAFQTGESVAPRDRSHRYFLTFNRSDDACRLQDVLTGLRYLTDLGAGPVEVMGSEKAAQWALYAAALAPQGVRLAGPEAPDLDDDALARDLFVPGLRRGGGGAAARRLLTSVRSR